MKPNYDTAQEKNDNTILFSKVVKAGKRIYYVDVKRDRREELYLSITESKRIKDGTDETRPVFEKHKIFLYREDLENSPRLFPKPSTTPGPTALNRLRVSGNLKTSPRKPKAKV